MRKAYFNGNAVASSFQNEFFPLTGGGILSIGLSNSTVKDTTFVGNVAQRGGGMFAQVCNSGMLCVEYSRRYFHLILVLGLQIVHLWKDTRFV